MSDSRLSALKRLASTGDHSARVAWISEWLRADPACEACAGTTRGRPAALERVRDDMERAARQDGHPIPDDAAWLEQWDSTAQGVVTRATWLEGDQRCSLQRIVSAHQIAGPPPCKACHGTGTERRWRVEAAAWAGDPAAQAATRVPLAVDRWAWAEGFSRWGSECAVRAACAAEEAGGRARSAAAMWSQWARGSATDTAPEVAISSAINSTSMEHVRSAVLSALVPWLLGAEA